MPHETNDAIARSWAIQSDASRRGFDWPDIQGVLGKVREELGEIEEAWGAGDRNAAQDELGDLLFATVNLARFLDVDPAEALGGANARFQKRFALLEAELQSTGKVMEECSLEELDEVWEWVKRSLHQE